MQVFEVDHDGECPCACVRARARAQAFLGRLQPLPSFARAQEQRVLNTRTVKTIGEGGLESFTTVVLDSLHYESYLMCTNCGPLGLKGENVEPSTNRSALTDRSIHHIVHSTDEHASAATRTLTRRRPRTT